jgi:hypothetical protein
MGILGQGLGSTTRADVDGVAGSNLMIISDGEIEIDIPAGQGTVFVTATTADGTSPRTAQALFSYSSRTPRAELTRWDQPP